MAKTYTPTPSDIERHWYVVDAKGIPLGRVASQVARLLTGKHKPIYAPHVDTGDFVVVVNAAEVALTGRKEEQKIYYRHTGRPGSLRSETARERRSKRPDRLVEAAVWGMLPKNSVGRRQLRKLKVYSGPEHPHVSQNPAPYDVRSAGPTVQEG